jgi:hypothetical protein
MKPYIFIFPLLISVYSFAQKDLNGWTSVKPGAFRGEQQIVPQKCRYYLINKASMRSALVNAPSENDVNSGRRSVIGLPFPDGTIKKFEVYETGVMSRELKENFNGINTFQLRGIDVPSQSGTMDWTLYGLHAMIFSAEGVIFIDPYSNTSDEQYISYYAHDFRKYQVRTPGSDHEPGTFTMANDHERKLSAAPCSGAQLRTYRLAMACTGEYAKAATGLSNPTIAQTLSKIVTSVNRVTGIYEREVSIRLQLVATTTAVIFTDPASDPFTGNNAANTLIAEGQTVITNNVGSSAFDIGHVFSTGTGGLATLGSACKSTEKARGTTGLPNPTGDPFDVDFVAHEMGHQFDAEHTYNAITGNCSSQRDAASAVEPGSGITIMGYAGICGTNDLEPNSMPYFHAVSYDQITAFITSANGGCATVSNTGNNPPVVNVAPAHVIPAGTPFVLTGSATDPDNDALTYSWEEIDIAATAGNWNSNLKPFFRSYPPVNSPSRSFPTESVVLTGNYQGTRGEFLTSTAQTLKFRLTARDNKAGGGGVCSSTTAVTLVDGGAFKVVYPSGFIPGWLINTQKTILWDVNNTNTAPVSCDSVRILLSFNSGTSYTVIVPSTPNDGSQTVTVPVVSNEINTCRIKIQCRNNIFYDVSDNDFTISNDPEVGILDSPIRNQNVRLWPSPFSSHIYIGSADKKDQAFRYEVTNILGSEIMHGSSRYGDKILIPPSAQGVYLLKIFDGENQYLFKAIRE